MVLTIYMTVLNQSPVYVLFILLDERMHMLLLKCSQMLSIIAFLGTLPRNFVLKIFRADAGAVYKAKAALIRIS